MTTKTVEVQDAQHQLAELVEQVAAGAEIILTDGQMPRARLIALAPATTRRVPGLHAGSITTSLDFDAPLPDDFWAGKP
jgi:antitoxin (DNA-binding transcriptional repressor) of toxin-antitoxin stability system